MQRRLLQKIAINKETTLRDALKSVKLAGTCFVINAESRLIGVVTDGDLKRAPLRGYDLDTAVEQIMNTDFFYSLEGTSDDEILASLPHTVNCIPVVDTDKKLVGYLFSNELQKKVALISGINGQDGAYLGELLLSKGYTVFGGYRRTSNLNFSRLEYLGIENEIKLIPLDVTDQGSVFNAIQKTKATEVYNLAAQSFVEVSFNQPRLTLSTNTSGTVNFLEAIRYFSPSTKFYQASTSEIFGNAEPPQDENTRFQPRSPYAISKLASYWFTKNYRESYGLFACSGILFNHESPIRGEEFVTRKITKGIARIKAGLDSEIRLGNLDAKRDWGYAKDYVEAMWLMLQQNDPDDFVIATGKTYKVKEFAELAFKMAGLDYRDYIVIDPRYIRPADVELLQGNPQKAVDKLGWNPQKTKFEELVAMMLQIDMEHLGLTL